MRQNTLVQTEQEMQLDYQQSRMDFENNWDNFYNQKDNLQIAHQNYQNIDKQYKNGLRTALDLLEAQQSLINVENLYLQALHRLISSRVLLERSLGLIVTE